MLKKCPTGIQGLDEITFGGLPRGRPTLISGGPGTGKTLFATQFLLRGLTDHQESGALLSFEESAAELHDNLASFDFDLTACVRDGMLRIEHVPLQPNSLLEAGEYDLEALFIRLGAAIESVNAQRVVIDGIDSLFQALQNERLLRAEFQRLVRWLKDRRVTAIITCEAGSQALTRHGVEEYLSDCVIALDQRVDRQIATRRLRIVKYRGSAHGPNEYPFILDEDGIWVMPVTSLGLGHRVSDQRISSGIPDLDDMLGGQGYHRGSTILVTGTGGTGKSSMAAHFGDAACRRGERCFYFALEESPAQIQRNMRSIGVELGPWIEQGLWHFHAVRSTALGLEAHLANISRLIKRFKPDVAIVDPITAFAGSVENQDIKVMLMRLVDLFKEHGITAFFTSLTNGSSDPEETVLGVSSLVDSWLLLRNLEAAGERTRGLYVLKSRGTAHSNQIREFRLGANGITLADVELDAEGNVLIGAARLHDERRRDAERELHADEMARRRRQLQDRQRVMEAKFAAMRAEFESELRTLEEDLANEDRRLAAERLTTVELAARRQSEA